MKRTSALLFSLILSSIVAAQPPSKAELDKMLKQQQDILQKMKNDPRYKQQNGVIATSFSDGDDYGNADNWKFPPKNETLIASLPKKPLNRSQLVSFLNETLTQLTKKMPAGIAASIQTISKKLGNDGLQMENLAIDGWYTNYREEALMLIVKAAVLRPDDGLLLNNCAAILNMSGMEQFSIPILKYVAQFYPDDAMVLNNIGQAYAGLGETDTAMYYLGRCLKSDPDNAEANNTAGQIEVTKGNKEKAADYFEKSLSSAYSKPAELKLRKIRTESMATMVRPRVKVPEYFNQYKYKLPAQCTNVEGAAQAEAEQTAFREMISKLVNTYGSKAGELGQNMYARMASMSGRIKQKGEFMAQPFYELCGIMARDLLSDFSKELHDVLSRVDKNYFAAVEKLKNEYSVERRRIEKSYSDREKPQCCGEGNVSCCIDEEKRCREINDLGNKYLPQFALLTEEWQEKNQNVFRKYFDQLIYWSYLSYHPLGDDHFRAQSFYPLVLQFLLMLGKIDHTEVIKPCQFTPSQATADSIDIKEIDCPLDLTIPFVVGKLQLTCDKFSFSGGEGLVFSYEKDFKTKQSTLSLGIGVKLELGGKMGPIKGGVSIGADESLFITFDGNNGFSDAGLSFNAKAGGGANAAGVVKKGESVSAGYSFGINSGCNFNEGPFKGMLGPAPDVQQNKNVKIYKSGR
ncbi:MAG: tetratricopeptide repeat protein [Flavisolibacter sp.]